MNEKAQSSVSPPDGFITVESFAEKERIAPLDVIEKVREGSLIGRKIGDQWFIKFEFPESRKAKIIYLECMVPRHAVEGYDEFLRSTAVLGLDVRAFEGARLDLSEGVFKLHVEAVSVAGGKRKTLAEFLSDNVRTVDAVPIPKEEVRSQAIRSGLIAGLAVGAAVFAFIFGKMGATEFSSFLASKQATILFLVPFGVFIAKTIHSLDAVSGEHFAISIRSGTGNLATIIGPASKLNGLLHMLGEDQFKLVEKDNGAKELVRA